MKFSRNVENMIASLRGLPTDSKSSYTRQIQSIDQVITSVLEYYKIEPTPVEETVIRNWRTLLGKLAERCAPERIEGPVLVIRVANPVIREEIRFNERLILRKIQRLPRCSSIRSIKFR